MAPHPRVIKAFRAMMALGIPDTKIRPALKKLLKLYDKNWEPIEQENYRALADAIFDSDESEAAEQKKKLDDAEAAEKKKIEQAEQLKAVEDEPQIQEEPRKQFKRPGVKHRDDQASPSCVSPNINSGGNLLKVPKLEVNDKLPESQPELQSPADIPVTRPVLRTDPRPISPLKEDMNNEKVRVKPEDEPLTDDPVRVEAPLAWILPDRGTDCSGDPPVSTDAMSPAENGFEGNNHSIHDETVDIAEGQESAVNTDAMDSLKTKNVFKKETKKGRKESNHFIPDETTDTDKGNGNVVNKTGNDSEKETENVFVKKNGFISEETNDIAKGEESVEISLVNEVNSECPPSFIYIPRNAVFQSACVNFSLARITKENCCSTCFGNCLTSSTPCPCTLSTGGEFAYTSDGTLNEDVLDDCIQTNRDPQRLRLSYCKECPLEKPKKKGVLGTCKGHLDRSFIKECWLKCGCNKKCGNRVVQRGIRYKLQVFMTPGGKGWGLRALEDLPKGAFVCEFVGEVLTCKELYNRVSQSSKKDEYTYPVYLDAEWGEVSELREDETLCLDATYYGNVARFINHRCFDANLVEIPVEVENPDRHYYHLAFFTTRKVKALEELTRDYGIDFDDNDDLVKAFECQCGSPFCRNIKGSSGSRKRKYAKK